MHRARAQLRSLHKDVNRAFAALEYDLPRRLEMGFEYRFGTRQRCGELS